MTSLEATSSGNNPSENVQKLKSNSGDGRIKYSFICECFFMTARVLNLGLLKAFSDYKHLVQVRVQWVCWVCTSAFFKIFFIILFNIFWYANFYLVNGICLWFTSVLVKLILIAIRTGHFKIWRYFGYLEGHARASCHTSAGAGYSSYWKGNRFIYTGKIVLWCTSSYGKPSRLHFLLRFKY